MRVSATRFRIPDICVMLKSQRSEPVLTAPPFLCIEIVSPDDRMSRVIERVKEYLAFGVRHVWVVDPETRTAHSYIASEGHEEKDRLTTVNPEISVSVPQLFRNSTRFRRARINRPATPCKSARSHMLYLLDKPQ